MRDRISRGKRHDNGEWVYWDRYGCLTDINGEPIRIEINTSALRPYAFYVNDLPAIRRETFGDYTDAPDKNGKKIFEGDIVTYIGEVCVVEWDDETAKFVLKNENVLFDFEDVRCNRFKFKSQIEVIGNVHDNPELLEVEE